MLSHAMLHMCYTTNKAHQANHIKQTTSIMVPYYWLQQRNYFTSIAYEYSDKNQEVPRKIQDRLKLIEAVIREHKNPTPEND